MHLGIASHLHELKAYLPKCSILCDSDLLFWGVYLQCEVLKYCAFWTTACFK